MTHDGDKLKVGDVVLRLVTSSISGGHVSTKPATIKKITKSGFAYAGFDKYKVKGRDFPIHYWRPRAYGSGQYHISIYANDAAGRLAIATHLYERRKNDKTAMALAVAAKELPTTTTHYVSTLAAMLEADGFKLAMLHLMS